jgi:hypothetical protein
MADLERLARMEGELWARRIRDQLVRWDGPLQMDWPGRPDEAHMLAATLTDGSRTRAKLAKVIQERAAIVWHHLNESA